jgi:hypothetical protein
MKSKLQNKWDKHKRTVIYYTTLAGVTGIAILIGRNAVQSGMIKSLDAERKHLKNELRLTEDVAWEWHDLSMDLLNKYRPSSEELKELVKPYDVQIALR